MRQTNEPRQERGEIQSWRNSNFMVLTAIILFAIIFSLGLMIIVVLLSEENIGPGGKK